MEQNKADRLNENVTEKMCSSDGNVVGEMCSPADADTCGNSLLAVEETLSLCGLAGFFEDYALVFLAGKNVYRI